ncbi:MAG: MucR family transcriptional regulator [Desulfovibrio sp.]|nr:MucR family transcriptional regulator [Desulfovibrio sp.]
MDDYFKEALELARAQAGVRIMNEKEIAAFVAKVTASLKDIAGDGECACEPDISTAGAKKSIKEKSVTCLECGKSFKILTVRHLSRHGLTAEEYKAKYGLKKGTALVCKSLQRERRKKMQDMKLWEKRRKTGA